MSSEEPHLERSASQVMERIAPSLVNQFVIVTRFLIQSPESASAVRGKNAPEVGSLQYLERIASQFARGREPRSPSLPQTIPDEMIGLVLEHYFDQPAETLGRITDAHALAMAAENIIGDLLERYIATVLEPLGWVWCSGTFIRATDFIKPPHQANEGWITLQVKNRDNSENSSSSSVRKGTTILKWHRTFSKRKGTNWPKFPDEKARNTMTEDLFKAFVANYLASLRRA